MDGEYATYRWNVAYKRIGAESFLFAMIDRLEFDMAMSTSSLQCVAMDASLRKRAADALLPNQKTKARSFDICADFA